MGKLGAGRVLALILAVMAMFVIAACGDDDDPTPAAAAAVRRAARSVVGTTGLDNADPVMFQTIQAVQPFQLVYVPLLTYAHKEGEAGTEIIPGLATEVPEPTNGGKTYEFTLREGLKYSDGTAVKASDFENTIKRLLALGSGWSFFYSPIIEGTEEFQEKADIEGRHHGHRDRRRDRRRSRSRSPSRTRRSCSRSPSPTRHRPRRPSHRARASSSRPPASARTSSTSKDFNRLVRAEAEPELDGHPGHPEGQLRQDHGRRQRQRHEDDPGRDQRQARLHDRGPDGRPAAGGPAEVRRPLLRGAEPAERLLLLPERHAAAVRQAGGARRP